MTALCPSSAQQGACDMTLSTHGSHTELYSLRRSELSRRNLSPTLATAHYSSPDNAIGLVAQHELSGYVKLGWLLKAVRRKFSHRPGNPTTVGVVRWPSAGDTAGYRLRRPKLTPVSLISIDSHRISLHIKMHRSLASDFTDCCQAAFA